MVDLYQDIERLHRFLDDDCGLESFSLITRFQDFLGYFGSRFKSNLLHLFRDYDHSQIVEYNKRYPRQIELLTRSKLLPLKDIIVPIPKGMVNTYHETLLRLTDILGNLGAGTLSSDIDHLQELIGSQDQTKTFHPRYSKSQFEADKQHLSQFFTKTGLDHAVASSVFSSVDEIDKVNKALLILVEEYYPSVLFAMDALNRVDRKFRDVGSDSVAMNGIRDRVMDCAYRLSLFAIVMEHIQDIEHGVVMSLNVFRKTAH